MIQGCQSQLSVADRCDSKGLLDVEEVADGSRRGPHRGGWMGQHEDCEQLVRWQGPEVEESNCREGTRAMSDASWADSEECLYGPRTMWTVLTEQYQGGPRLAEDLLDLSIGRRVLDLEAHNMQDGHGPPWPEWHDMRKER